jgi:hypothetical protein
VVGDGIDCSTEYFFDETTKKLVAVGQWGLCGSWCTATVAGFRWPTECFDPTYHEPLAQLGSVSVCPDAGVIVRDAAGDVAPE